MKEIILQTIEREIQALRLLKQCCMEELEQVCAAIVETKGKVVFMGIGKSGHIGEKLAAAFSSLGIRSIFVHAAEAVHGDLGMIDEDDFVILMSNSGTTTEVLQNLEPLTARHIVCASFTGNRDSALAQACDYHIHYPKPTEADEWNLAPTSSTTMMLVLGDALACALSSAKQFQKQDFFRYHPGGSLGKQLKQEQNKHCVN